MKTDREAAFWRTHGFPFAQGSSQGSRSKDLSIAVSEDVWMMFAGGRDDVDYGKKEMQLWACPGASSIGVRITYMYVQSMLISSEYFAY